MARIKRRRRADCKLACVIVQSAKKQIPGRVVTLSEGGFAVVTPLALDQGDPVRVVIDPKGARPIRVSAIVWNDTAPAATLTDGSRMRRLGCVVSQPSDSFAALLDRLLPDEAKAGTRSRPSPDSVSVPITVPKKRDPDAEWAEPDLPRSRELQPPTKVEAEESLPYFRIRLKQIGGPRTRILTIQARSATQAEQRALEELSKVCKDSDGWGILHVAKML